MSNGTDTSHNMETRYVKDAEYVVFINSKGDKAELITLNGHARWKIVEDGDEYICRPESTKPNE